MKDEYNNPANDQAFPSYLCIKEPGRGEIAEKKSRFLSVAAHAGSEEEAMRLIEVVKKEHWDARHHCWAFIIGSRSGLMRYSDDGEPQGTAGKPMLDALSRLGLTDTVAVVTRYFGGILLGTGGLVRAYTQALQKAIGHAEIIRMRYGHAVTVNVEYSDIGKVQYLLEQQNIPILASAYEEKAAFKIMLPLEATVSIRQAITEVTQARASTIITGADYFEAEQAITV